MQIRSTCLLIALAFCFAAFSGCSRESSIRENVTLRNNHSVVFAFNHPFENPTAFADSIINLSNPDSVLVYDTVTVTVNDTVYLMGFLRYNTDRIYRYIWHIEEPYQSGDSLKKDCEFFYGTAKKGCTYLTENTTNATAYSHVFKKEGVYSPLFIAIDGNNARDTAGVGQYIRVINTIPYLSVPEDTLWTKSDGSVTFPIVAVDSFGTIKSLQIDLDASGKAKPKDLDTKKLSNDTLYVTVDFDSNYVNSKGNQMVYIIAKDDDGNEVKDSVNIHFNQKPSLKIISPLDSATVNEKEYQILHFEAKDDDNPGALRYFVRASNPIPSDTSMEVFIPQMTNRYLIAENLKEPYYVIIDNNGTNLANLSGRIYWDVWATDGYDTVFVDKIIENGKARPHTFLLVDLKNPFGTFKGYVKHEGSSKHEGIVVEISDSTNKYVTTTDASGYYFINIPSGGYNLYAHDSIPNGFKSASVKNLHIEIGETKKISNLTLKDSVQPTIEIDNQISQTKERDIKFTGMIQDVGSGLKTMECILDATKKCKITQGAKYQLLNKQFWETKLEDLSDGKHNIKWTATDSAGLSSELSFDFYVSATEIEATIKTDNTEEASIYQVSYMADQSETNFEFRAILKDANPIPDSIFWKSNINSKKTYASLVNKETSTAELKLPITDLPLENGRFYEMTAYTDRNGGIQSNRVRFGIMTAGIPVVYFTKPKTDTTISINDLITFEFFSNPNNSVGAVNQSESPILSYEKDGHTTKLDINSFTPTESGSYKFIVSLTNYGDQKTTQDSLIVTVEKDPPTLKATLLVDNPDRIKFKTYTPIRIDASDIFGTIEKLEYGCGSEKTVSLAEDPNFTAGQKNITDHIIEVTAPNNATDKYKCIIRITDDDGQTATDSISYKVRSDIPFIEMSIKETYLTINDTTKLEFFAMDTLGHIDSVQQACSETKSNLTSWTTVYIGQDIRKGNYTAVMPEKAGKYYCAIRVYDDDKNHSEDTTTFNVLKASPSVKIIGSFDGITIKDQIRLGSDARDSLQYKNFILNGGIVKYQWGCAHSSESEIPLTFTSAYLHEFITYMPDEADNKYRCAVVVTDDDGNTASDTVSINVMKDAPKVKVIRKEATTRTNANIALDANASDGYGDIVKTEWSCGIPNDIENNWVESRLDTTWKVTTPKNNFMCVVRVTDDDGNTAYDTTRVYFSTIDPILTANDELIYLRAGQEFELSASKNKEWTDDNVSWYKWQCYIAETQKAVKNEQAFDFKKSFVISGKDTIKFFKAMDESYTEDGKDLYCVISAEESSTGAVFYDTTQIKIMIQLPTGVISAADTVYLYSDDETIDGEALYYYTDEWNAKKSTMGPIGDKNNQTFRWKFGNIGSDSYYEGNKDGSIDTSTYEFNLAFMRSTTEGAMSICLDYRDSTATQYNDAFYKRHQAEETCRTIYFKKAWQNTVNDTVIQYAKVATAPVMTSFGTKPIIAYLTSNTKVASKYYQNNSWNTISTSNITASDSITSLNIARCKNDVFLTVLTSGMNLTLYKSSSGTQAWTKVYEVSKNATQNTLSCQDDIDNPVVAYINNNYPNFAFYDGSKWQTKEITTTYKFREIAVSCMGANRLAFVYIQNNSSYTTRYAIYNKNGTSFSSSTKNDSLAREFYHLELLYDNSSSNGQEYLMIGAYNRDNSNMNLGPQVMLASLSNNKLSLKNVDSFNQPFAKGLQTNRISLATHSGILYAAIDDRNSTLGYTHIYKNEGNGWKLLGENILPYFKTVFYESNQYFLYGSKPDITITSDGEIFISMLGWESSGGRQKNFGPIVMRYAAANWKVH